MMYGGVSKPSTRQPDLLVDVERERPARALHPLAAEPALGAREERARDLLVVDGVEEAEEAGVVVVPSRCSRSICAVTRPTHQPLRYAQKIVPSPCSKKGFFFGFRRSFSSMSSGRTYAGRPGRCSRRRSGSRRSAAHRNLPDVHHGAEDGYHDPGLSGSSDAVRLTRSVARLQVQRFRSLERADHHVPVRSLARSSVRTTTSALSRRSSVNQQSALSLRSSVR